MRVWTIGIAAAVVGVVGYVSPSPSKESGQKSDRLHSPRLFKDSRQSLAIARAQGRRDFVLVVVAVTGRTAAAAKDAVRLGGDVRFRDDEVGYLRVRLPVERATEFSESPNVEAAAADVDDSYPSRLTPNAPSVPNVGSEPGLQQAGSTSDQWPPRLGDYPLRHPYSPLKDIGAADLRTKSPTFDGRGVTIALLDGNLDLLLPEFQTAYALDGSRVPKVAD